MKSSTQSGDFINMGDLVMAIKTGKKNNGEDIGSAAFGGNALLPERVLRPCCRDENKRHAHRGGRGGIDSAPFRRR